MRDRAFLISSQLKKPVGLIGRLTARKMEQQNSGLYRRFAELVEFTAADRILEIGSGPGYGIEYIAGTYDCFVDGIDYSELMYRIAAKRNRALIKAGRVRLHCTNIADFAAAEASYTKVLAANMVYFWREPFELFRPLSHLLTDDGLLLLFMGRRESLESNPAISTEVLELHEIETVHEHLERAGFGRITVTEEPLAGEDAYYVVAGK